MTCIIGLVGKKGVLLVGDAQTSTEWIKREDASAKVFQLMETVAFGYCGSGRFGQILQYHIDPLESPPLAMDEHRWVVKHFVPHLRTVTEEHGHLHVYHNVEEFGPSAFLLAVRGRLFCVESDFGVSEHVLPFESVGSGAEAAVGALMSELGRGRAALDDKIMLPLATRAIRSAKDSTLYVGGKITSVSTVRWTSEERALARRILAR